MSWSLSTELQDLQCDPVILLFDHIDCNEDSCANPCEGVTCDRFNIDNDGKTQKKMSGGEVGCGNMIDLINNETRKVLDFGFFEVAIIRQEATGKTFDFNGQLAQKVSFIKQTKHCEFKYQVDGPKSTKVVGCVKSCFNSLYQQKRTFTKIILKIERIMHQ